MYHESHLLVDQVALNSILSGLEYFQGGTSTFLGNLFHCLTNLAVKNFFLVSNLIYLPSFSLKPFLLVPTLHALVKNPTLAFF